MEEKRSLELSLFRRKYLENVGETVGNTHNTSVNNLLEILHSKYTRHTTQAVYIAGINGGSCKVILLVVNTLEAIQAVVTSSLN